MTSPTLPAEAPSENIAAWQRWMRTLTMAGPDTLDAAWQGWQPKPAV